MMIFFLVACFAYKTTLIGIIDHVGSNNCTVELDTGELIYINSKLCVYSKEGDKIQFYVRRK